MLLIPDFPYQTDGSHVEGGYCKAPRGILTPKCYGYSIADKSDDGQDASLRIEMGNISFGDGYGVGY